VNVALAFVAIALAAVTAAILIRNLFRDAP
jgi:hypothetical protein